MTSRFEGTPMVAIEAQILGVPIVSTPVDGMKEIVTNGFNGYTSNDNNDFVEKCLLVINNNALYKPNCIKWANENLNVEKYKNTLLLCYEKVLKE